MNKKKKFFACSACLLGFFICSCEVMADAPDDVIISILNNYPDYFKQNNIIFDVIRWISWLLITLLRVIANFCVTLYEYSFLEKTTGRKTLSATLLWKERCLHRLFMTVKNRLQKKA